MAPSVVNPAVASVPCAGSPAETGAGRVRPLRVVAHFHGHRQLRVTVLHVIGPNVLVTARRGKHLLVLRRVRARHGTARLRVKASHRGVYRLTAVDPGPPLRTARAKRRVR